MRNEISISTSRTQAHVIQTYRERIHIFLVERIAIITPRHGISLSRDRSISISTSRIEENEDLKKKKKKKKKSKRIEKRRSEIWSYFGAFSPLRLWSDDLLYFQRLLSRGKRKRWSGGAHCLLSFLYEPLDREMQGFFEIVLCPSVEMDGKPSVLF